MKYGVDGMVTLLILKTYETATFYFTQMSKPPHLCATVPKVLSILMARIEFKIRMLYAE